MSKPSAEAAALCCLARSCPECRNWTRVSNDFRAWLEGKYDKRKR